MDSGEGIYSNIGYRNVGLVWATPGRIGSICLSGAKSQLSVVWYQIYDLASLPIGDATPLWTFPVHPGETTQANLQIYYTRGIVEAWSMEKDLFVEGVPADQCWSIHTPFGMTDKERLKPLLIPDVFDVLMEEDQ